MIYVDFSIGFCLSLIRNMWKIPSKYFFTLVKYNRESFYPGHGCFYNILESFKNGIRRDFSLNRKNTKEIGLSNNLLDDLGM